MPKKPIDYVYEKGYVYSIRDPDGQVLYVGSTVNFQQRKWDHKKRFTDEKRYGYNCKIYRLLRSISTNFDDFIWKIEETCENVTHLDLKVPENNHKKNLNPIGNDKNIRDEIMVNETTNRKEYRKQLNMIPEIHEKKRCENKKWRDQNKNEIKKKMQKYYLKNKNTLNLRKSEKINCEFCNKLICRSYKSEHIKKYCKNPKHNSSLDNINGIETTIE